MLSAEHTHLCHRLRLPITTTALVATLTVAIAEAPAASFLARARRSPASCWTVVATSRSRLPTPACSLPDRHQQSRRDRGRVHHRLQQGEHPPAGQARHDHELRRTGRPGDRGDRINDRGLIVGAYSDDTPFVNNSARPRAMFLIALIAASSRGWTSPARPNLRQRHQQPRPGRGRLSSTLRATRTASSGTRASSPP